MITDPAIEEYVTEHSGGETPLLEEVAATTRSRWDDRAGMMVGPLEGGLLAALVAIARPRLVVEIGTFTGYSALWMAAALPADGRLIACEVDPEHAALARGHVERSDVADRIDLRVGPALDTLATIDEPIDVAFIDAEKTGYPDYYEAVLPKLAPTGFMVFDNMLREGRVMDRPAPGEDPGTAAIRALNDRLASDDRVEVVMLPVRDGISIVRHRR